MPRRSRTPCFSIASQPTTRVSPDIAVVSLGVQTQGADVGAAVQENNRRARAVTDALLEKGVAAEDMRTVNFYVSSQQLFDPMGLPTGETSYTVDNTILFTLRAPDKLGEVLQAALRVGSNSVQSGSFSGADPSVAEPAQPASSRPVRVKRISAFRVFIAVSLPSPISGCRSG